MIDPSVTAGKPANPQPIAPITAISGQNAGVTPATIPMPDASTDSPYRILVVEDDRSQALFAEAILRGAGMHAEVVAVPEQVMATMERFDPDLVLMDLHMPGASGTTLTRQIREHPRFSQVPVVFLTGDQDPERQLEALEHGGDDYILKPVRPRHLIAAVQSRVRRARIAQHRQATHGEPEHHPITGLFTRPALMKKLAALLPQRSGGALMLEAGSVTALRNHYGYAEFEQLMNDAGRHLGSLVPAHAAARLSDNAFLIVADAAGISLETLARSLRDGMGYHDFHVGKQPVRLRTTVGYADLAHGFHDAGAALSAAEEGARAARTDATGIGTYHPPSASATTAADDLLGDIRNALDGDNLPLAFQPVVAVAGGDEAQFQVLLRMRDSAGNLRNAGEILPLAEAANLLPQLDRRVLQQSLGLLQRRRAESRPVRLFVSQSPRTLAQDNYATWLAGEIETASIDGPSLVIDIRLEDAILHSMVLRQFCEQLVPVGVQFCLSQYRHSADAELLLQQLPLGYLRLSAEYARQPLPLDLRDEMREAIDRAHRLGLQVIGQAVEDPQAAAALWMGGIDFIQGNLVQRAEHELNFDFQHATL